MSDDFDVVVVGAGPAGSAAAWTLAEHGVSVLVLEEHATVGIPVTCAEGLSRSTIKGYLDIKKEWIAQELSGAIVRGPDGQEFTIEYPRVGWILNRNIFDAALARIAREKGAVVKTSAKALGIHNGMIMVTEQGEKKYYRFKLLIGADGIASRVGMWMGIDTRLSMHEVEVCAAYIMKGIALNERYTYLIFGQEYAPGGYAWLFPKSDRTVNVGLGLSPLCTKRRAKDILDAWVNREFPDATIQTQIFGGVPAQILKEYSGKNFFLVGDAARLTDPLSGAGIANAIKSGVIAGQNAVLRLKGKKDYYVQEIKKEILNEIAFHHRVRKLYLKLTDAEYREIFKIGKRFFAGKTVDDINIRSIVKEVLFSSPRFLRLGFNLLF